MSKSLSNLYVDKKRRWNLILARLSLGLTQAAVGEKIGMSEKAYGSIETNYVNLDETRMSVLSEFFGISTEKLFSVIPRPKEIPEMNNRYKVNDDGTATIFIKHKGDILEALISENKLNKILAIKTTWFGHTGGGNNLIYVTGHLKLEDGTAKQLKLHRVLMDAPGDMVVDHINHNTLDNRDENLRLATMSENKQNLIGAHANSKSGIRGVSWDDHAKKWKAVICVEGNIIRCGRFKDINEAEKAVIKARKKYMPYSQEALT